jgi:hypothetical protein
MPQFDFYCFSVQIFWVLLGFFMFYFFMQRYYVKSTFETFKIRKKLMLLNTNLNQASLQLFPKGPKSFLIAFGKVALKN